MGLSQKDIYNNALQKVSRRRISTIDDGSYEANLCNDLFPRTLDNTLYEHNWNSCAKRAELVKLSEAPPHGYANAFQLPNDCVRVIQGYYNERKESFDFEWQIEGRTLLTNQESVFLRYVFRPTNFEALNSAITECIVFKLAMALVIPLQLDRADEQSMLQEYERITLPRAKSLDSMESRYLEFEENPWIESMQNDYPQI
jgi:hypothetical protein